VDPNIMTASLRAVVSAFMRHRAGIDYME
jgi:hypothetical protein